MGQYELLVGVQVLRRLPPVKALADKSCARLSVRKMHKGTRATGDWAGCCGRGFPRSKKHWREAQLGITIGRVNR